MSTSSFSIPSEFRTSPSTPTSASPPITYPQVPEAGLFQTARHHKYFESYIVLLVDDVLYRIPVSLLSSFSYFNEENCDKEFSSEQDPLVIQGVNAADFDCLLDVLSARQIDASIELALEEWASALQLANLWGSTTVRNFAIKRMEAQFTKDNIHARIKLTLDCDVEDWWLPALQILCTREEPIGADIGETLGHVRTAAAWSIREEYRSQLYDSNCRDNRVFNFDFGVLRTALEWIRTSPDLQFDPGDEMFQTIPVENQSYEEDTDRDLEIKERAVDEYSTDADAMSTEYMDSFGLRSASASIKPVQAEGQLKDSTEGFTLTSGHEPPVSAPVSSLAHQQGAVKDVGTAIVDHQEDRPSVISTFKSPPRKWNTKEHKSRASEKINDETDGLRTPPQVKTSIDGPVAQASLSDAERVCSSDDVWGDLAVTTPRDSAVIEREYHKSEVSDGWETPTRRAIKPVLGVTGSDREEPHKLFTDPPHSAQLGSMLSGVKKKGGWLSSWLGEIEEGRCETPGSGHLNHVYPKSIERSRRGDHSSATSRIHGLATSQPSHNSRGSEDNDPQILRSPPQLLGTGGWRPRPG